MVRFDWTCSFIWHFWSYSKLRRLYWSSHEIYIYKNVLYDVMEAGQELAKDLEDKFVDADYSNKNKFKRADHPLRMLC
jgi:hypothetical protein